MNDILNDKMTFLELHDLLCKFGNEIGYINALSKFSEKAYIHMDNAHLLKDTLFADSLKKELAEKQYFREPTSGYEYEEYYLLLKKENEDGKN